MNNVVDLFTLVSRHDHPHGLDDQIFEDLFTNDKHIIFAFHGHPSVIHNLIYHRPNPQRFHVHGYIEEGTTTTPFDMAVCNHLSRFHLAMNAIKYIPQLKSEVQTFNEEIEKKLKEHKKYIFENGQDMPEITDWTWKNV